MYEGHTYKRKIEVRFQDGNFKYTSQIIHLHPSTPKLNKLEIVNEDGFNLFKSTSKDVNDLSKEEMQQLIYNLIQEYCRSFVVDFKDYRSKIQSSNYDGWELK